MVRNKIVGYIIKIQKYKDTDSIITIFSETGLYTVFGRGYKKPKSKYHVLNNNFLKVKIYSKELKKIKIEDFEIMNVPQFSLVSYNIVSTVNKIVQLTIRNSESNTAKNLYPFFEQVMENINDVNFEKLYYWYIIKILEANGIIINFKACVVCSSKQKIKTLSLTSGGLICESCYVEEKIMKLSEIKMIKMGFNAKIDSILSEEISFTDQTKEEIKTLLNESLGIYIKEDIWH